MKYNASLLALAVATVASARELSYQSFTKRDVPQEHSYDAILRGTNAALKLNNPLNIQDAVFGLLDNAAAAKGAGQVTNLDCLQQIVADQAFTNAKAAGDLDGQVNAVLFRALERETSQVGLASAICDETAKNPEIAVVHQHQDPASAEGQAKNKDIELVVAKVLKGLGADPLLALDSATSLPGNLLDATASNLLSPAITKEEILAAFDVDEDGLLRRAEDDTCEDDGTADDTGSDAGDDDTCEDDGTPDNTGDDAGDDDTCEDDGTPDDAGDDAGDDDTCEDDGTDDDNTGAPVSPKATTGNATGNNNTGGAVSPTAATGNGTGNTNTSGAVNPTATTGNDTGDDDTCEDDGTPDDAGDDAGDDDTCEDDGAADDAGDDAGDDDTCEDDGAADDAGDDAGDEDTCEDDGTDDDNTGGNNKTGGNTKTQATNTGSDNNSTDGATNVQSFKGTLGGAAPAVLYTPGSDRPYSVNGDSFPQASVALARSCDIQNNACFNAANTGKVTGGIAQCVQQNSECKAAATKTTVRREASKLGRRHGGLDFGSCGTPQIQFAKGLDGREEESFQPVNGQDFNHESALNIQVISEFVCQKLQDDCNASAEAVAACKQASSAASTAEGQQAAFLFNAALGI
ncbi:uncharacterized protein B0T23DRAFT_210089 [Neurospora hispaniola]|uniref:Uncharacterized protein n=1 Tax=Neurospora hispaniola TaxID=588809 RepID=A0AAJ0I245_9PEZI|nr:hypothetical protein B0T23DRAFT_210089 [Neurospora hispaniola]